MIVLVKLAITGIVVIMVVVKVGMAVLLVVSFDVVTVVLVAVVVFDILVPGEVPVGSVVVV